MPLLRGNLGNLEGGSPTYASKILAIPGVVYLPLTEVSGVAVAELSGRNVVGVATNVTWQDVDAPGKTMGKSPLFGATSLISLSVAALNAAGYNGAEFSMFAWVKNPGWAVAQTITALQVDSDGNNRNFIRQAGANSLAWFEQAGATILNASSSSGLNAGWLNVGFTVSKAGDAKINYLNGAQVGATQTGVGVYAGAAGTAATEGRG